MHRLGRISKFVSTLSVLIVIALCCVATACGADNQPTTMTNYTSKSQELEWGYRSQWKQPWRSYLETVPATTFLHAVGINFNVPVNQAAATAKLLGDSGFTRARIEIGWNSVEYNNPGKLTPAKAQSLRAQLTALKENGIRPLILLNANSGEPTPVKKETVTLAAAAPAGATEIHVSSGDVSKLVAGRSGITENGVAAQVLFKSVAANGTVTLSQPLPVALPAGSLGVTTLRFEPFRAEKLANGSANPAFGATMAGWLEYVAAVTQEAKAILGSDQFDVEVWNELGFGSQFLSVENYYSPGIEGGRKENEEAILRGTIAYIRNAANGLTDVGIGNGFSDERPWEAGSTSPVGLTAIDKHPYHGLVRFPEGEAPNGNRPLNGEGRLAAATQGSNGVWHESFTPTYDAFFPEYWLSGIQTETLVHDLSPNASKIGNVEHGRGTHPAGGEAPQVWITEVGLDPTEGPAEHLSAADIEHIKAKTTLRYLTSYINKGVTNLDFYAASDGNYSLVNQSFFSALSSSPSIYPGDAKGGETMTAVRRLTESMKGASELSKPRSLTLQSLTDYENKTQFEGNGTSAYPSLYNREVFAFLPFQVTNTKFVVPVYVMTRNVEQEYEGGSSPTRFDLPAEKYKMVIGGVYGQGATASATDPLTGATVPVQIVGHSAESITVEMEVTDSPRLLSIEDKGEIVAPAEGEAGEEEAPGHEEPAQPEEEEPVLPEEPAGPNEPTERPTAAVQLSTPETKPVVAASTTTSAAPASTPVVATTPTIAPKPKKPAAKPTPKVRLDANKSTLKNGHLQVVAQCKGKCHVRAQAQVKVGAKTFRLPTSTATGGGKLTIQLSLAPSATRAARTAAAQGSSVEAVAEVLTDGAPTQTVAAQIN
jgi:hypothetical protein